MYIRLVIVALVLVVLAGTHWKAYLNGRDAVRAQYQARELAAHKAAREREQELVAQRQKAEELYVTEKRKAAAAAAGARTELGRLRDQLAAGRPAPTDPATPIRVDGGSPEAQLLGACASALVGVAEDADRLAAQVIGLQAYVRGVCQKQ
jgi:ATPase subunit of ABC transporter with duplicated ATPase domains